MIGESYNEILQTMIHNNTDGSSWYFRRAIDLIEASNEIPVEKVSEDLLSLRPGMGSLNNISIALKKGSDLGMNRAQIGESLSSYLKYSFSALYESFSKLESGGTILTISRSSEVLNLVNVIKPGKVYLMESRPGNESEKFEADLEKLTDVEVIEDAAIGQFIARSDSIITGSDGFYSDGFFTNKTGTLPLLLTAEYMKKPVYVISSSYKFSNLQSKDQHLFRTRVPGTSRDVNLFEMVPVEKIGTLVTDTGIIGHPSKDTVMTINRRFIEKCLG